MSDAIEQTKEEKLASRARAGAVMALIALLYVLVQHSGFAPFPHGADDFVGGFAAGVAVVSGIAWIGARR